MSKNEHNQITLGDVDVPIEIDTELDDLSGYTIEIEFYNPSGTLLRTVTGADGGDGKIGKLVTYRTTDADQAAGVHMTVGRWAAVPKLSASGKLRHGTPPVYHTVVALGT